MEASLEAAKVAAEIEVSPKRQQRRFSAKEKLRILRQVDACTKLGELGALLRHEGIYSSYLTAWRRARQRGALSALAPRRRGPAPVQPNPLSGMVVALERALAKSEARATRAEALVDLQKKIASLLEIPLSKNDEVL